MRSQARVLSRRTTPPFPLTPTAPGLLGPSAVPTPSQAPRSCSRRVRAAGARTRRRFRPLRCRASPRARASAARACQRPRGGRLAARASLRRPGRRTRPPQPSSPAHRPHSCGAPHSRPRPHPTPRVPPAALTLAPVRGYTHAASGRRRRQLPRRYPPRNKPCHKPQIPRWTGWLPGNRAHLLDRAGRGGVRRRSTAAGGWRFCIERDRVHGSARSPTSAAWDELEVPGRGPSIGCIVSCSASSAFGVGPREPARGRRALSTRVCRASSVHARTPRSLTPGGTPEQHDRRRLRVVSRPRYVSPPSSRARVLTCASTTFGQRHHAIRCGVFPWVVLT